MFRHPSNSVWKIDINNTFGKNSFHYILKGKLYAFLQEASPTEFDAGGQTISQNTTNFDF